MTQSESEDELHRRLRRTPLTWDELKAIVLSPNIDDLSKLARSIDQEKYYRQCREDIKNKWESIYDYILCTKFAFKWVCAMTTDDVSCDVDSRDMNNNLQLRQRKKRSSPSFQEYLHSIQQKQSGGEEGKCNAQTQYNLCLNDFPYYFETGVQHWVLWKLGGDVTNDEIVKAKLDIAKQQSSQLKGGMKKNCWSSIADCVYGEITLGQMNSANDHEVFLHWINPPHLKSLPGIDHVHILFRGEGTSQL